MNGTAITALFAKMTPFNWLTMIALIVVMIGSGFMTYRQVHQNTDDISKNREMLIEMHETQVLMVDEVQDLNENMEEWMEKLYDLASEDNR